MDIRMPGTDGLEATRQIAADPGLSGVRVIILTTFEVDEYVFEAIRAGASGFLVKDTEPEDLVSAIRVVARGDALLAPSVTRTLISSIAGRGPAQPVDASMLSVLTDREREVLARVAAGMSNDQIAAALFMSPADRQDPHQPGDDQARRARPGPAGRDRLRDRPGPARPVLRPPAGPAPPDSYAPGSVAQVVIPPRNQDHPSAAAARHHHRPGPAIPSRLATP